MVQDVTCGDDGQVVTCASRGVVMKIIAGRERDDFVLCQGPGPGIIASEHIDG